MGNTLTIRFWAKVAKTPDENGCLNWLGYKNQSGYGRIQYGGQWNILMAAHRVAWQLAGKRFTPGLELLHKCSNPACVNINHLQEGTHFENMQQARLESRIGRRRKTERCNYEIN